VPRTSLPDGYFHVAARGVDARGSIFRDDDDRKTFLALMRHAARRHRWACHAYCLMGTHYHLVLETRRASLSSGLHRLNWLYALHYNGKYGRFGHVFADRFSARVIESEEYLFEACAYVLLNPVKAGLCESVEDWPWSYSRFGVG
jgi:putative transposase